MPRIRTVKPQYWSTPDPPSRDARLLYVAMWNWADDEGVGTAAPKELGAFAFPHDEDLTPGDIRELLREISRSFHCVFYEVGGRPYYCVENFDEHQVINKPTPSKRPKPSEAERFLYQQECTTPVVLPEPSPETTGPEHRNTGTQEPLLPTVGLGGAGGELVCAKPATPARGCRLPEDWLPDVKVRVAMQEEFPWLDLRYEHEKFCDYWHAKAGANATKRDWNATWRNWMRTQVQRGDAKRLDAPRAAARGGADEKAADWQRLKQERRARGA